MLCLFVQFLLVEGPTQLVECQLIICRADADIYNTGVGIFCIQVFASGKEIFSTPELDFIYITGFWKLVNQTIHYLHSFLNPAKFFIGAGHLVENLIIALIEWIIVK